MSKLSIIQFSSTARGVYEFTYQGHALVLQKSGYGWYHVYYKGHADNIDAWPVDLEQLEDDAGNWIKTKDAAMEAAAQWVESIKGVGIVQVLLEKRRYVRRFPFSFYAGANSLEDCRAAHNLAVTIQKDFEAREREALEAEQLEANHRAALEAEPVQEDRIYFRGLGAAVNEHRLIRINHFIKKYGLDVQVITFLTSDLIWLKGTGGRPLFSSSNPAAVLDFLKNYKGVK